MFQTARTLTVFCVVAWAAGVHGQPASDSLSADGTTDHDKVVHALGLHYFGAPAVSAFSIDDGTVELGSSIAVPTVGIRTWLTPRLGVDLGLGLGLASGAVSGSLGGTTVRHDGPTQVAFGVYAGMPIALVDATHVVLFAEPFLSYYHGAGNYTQPAPSSTFALASNSFTVGGDIAVEVHLGFLQLPQVSFEARLGIGFNATGAALTQNNGGNVSTNSTSNYSLAFTQGGLGFGQILLSSFNMTYYFGFGGH